MNYEGITVEELLERYVTAESERKKYYKWYGEEQSKVLDLQKERDSLLSQRDDLMARITELEEIVEFRDIEISEIKKMHWRYGR